MIDEVESVRLKVELLLDFLFLISRVGQMQNAQQQLLASFPAFIDLWRPPRYAM